MQVDAGRFVGLIEAGSVIPTIEHVERWADPFIDRLLDEEPAILLEVPRGSGKSTLLRSIAQRRNALVLDLDDDSVLQLVREDVGSALASPGLMAIDEFHRAPEVLSYVKRVVDRQGGAARFLLAGSVSSFLLPPGTETLTGRGHRLSLMPLAAAEIFGAKHRWLAELLSDGEPRNFRTTLERADGSVAAIEVKSARSVNQRDASGLTFLRDRLGDRFQCGILFHTGQLTARLGERVWAVPVAALWDGTSRPKDSMEDGRS